MDRVFGYLAQKKRILKVLCHSHPFLWKDGGENKVSRDEGAWAGWVATTMSHGMRVQQQGRTTRWGRGGEMGCGKGKLWERPLDGGMSGCGVP